MHNMADLRMQIEQTVAESGADIGVALRHLETGEEFMLNADTPVPLASVVKIPVIVAAFDQILQNRFQLDDRWMLKGNVKALGSGILRYLDDGLPLAVRDLLTLMTIISDNTATDMLMLRIGVKTINDLMHNYGLTNIHIAHTTTKSLKICCQVLTRIRTSLRLHDGKPNMAFAATVSVIVLEQITTSVRRAT